MNKQREEMFLLELAELQALVRKLTLERDAALEALISVCKVATKVSEILNADPKGN